jgi:hypothetical protein
MNCPVCGDPLDDNQVSNALSRVMEGEYICVQCGNREAMFDHRATDPPAKRRVCLYSDEPTGIMLVVEDEPGFEPYGRQPRDPLWAKLYCQAWNTAVGLSDRDVDDILASSMFGRWAHF